MGEKERRAPISMLRVFRIAFGQVEVEDETGHPHHLMPDAVLLRIVMLARCGFPGGRRLEWMSSMSIACVYITGLGQAQI